MVNNNPMAMIQEFIRFRNSFRGDPKHEVMKMLQSGRISQNELNGIQQTASQLQRMLNGMK